MMHLKLEIKAKRTDFERKGEKIFRFEFVHRKYVITGKIHLNKEILTVIWSQSSVKSGKNFSRLRTLKILIDLFPPKSSKRREGRKNEATNS